MNREEAIEVYNGLINTKIKEAFEFFAPELRKINEEEIRKDLIGGLMWQRDNLKSEGPHDNNLILPGFCLTVGEHLKYLEKQKEQVTDESDKIAAAYQLGRSDERKQKEQKSIPIPPPYWESAIQEQKPNSTEDMPYITDEHFFEREPADSFKYKLAEYMTKCCTKKEGPYGYEYGISAESILKMAEEELLKRGVVQKPAEWSEEDEKMVRFYENDYDNNLSNMSMCDVIENRIKFKGWLVNKLKSLRPQPKAERTLLDENIIDAAVAFVAQNDHFNCWGGIDKHTVIKALRSLRPSWKPSEEQMEAMEFVIKDYREDGCIATANYLQEILDQIKKL